jgi:hypothetical protein
MSCKYLGPFCHAINVRRIGNYTRYGAHFKSWKSEVSACAGLIYYLNGLETEVTEFLNMKGQTADMLAM